MNVAPVFTTKPVVSGNCHCPMGYAPGSNADRGCMYCDHPVRGTCHIDWGRDRWGHRIVDRSYRNGERLPIRYAHQTAVYVGGFWADLPEVRKAIEEAIDILKHKPTDSGWAFVQLENAARALPTREE